MSIRVKRNTGRSKIADLPVNTVALPSPFKDYRVKSDLPVMKIFSLHKSFDIE